MVYENEVWKSIIGYEGLYEVSNMGRIRSLERDMVCKNGKVRHYKENILKPYKDIYGYFNVYLRKNNKQRIYRVHRLVAIAFIPNIENKPYIDHINTIKIDNRVENLRWVTPKENSNNELSRKHNSEAKKGKNNPMYGKCHTEEAKRKMREVSGIKVVQLDKNTNELIKIWNSASEAGREGDFDVSGINLCCKGRRKTHKNFRWMYYEDYKQRRI